MTEFTELLNRVAARFPSRQALARAIGINASRLSRALNGTDKFAFNIENCLRLAQVSGEPASTVLRAAGKGNIATVIESLYGAERAVTDPAVQRLLTRWPELAVEEQQFLRVTVGLVLGAPRQVLSESEAYAIRHTGVSGPHTTPAGPARSSTKGDGHPLATSLPPDQRNHPVPRASPTAREQTLTAFKQATRDIEAADKKKARRHAAVPRVRVAGSAARVRKPRR